MNRVRIQNLFTNTKEANTTYDEAYVLEVPSDFTITNAGWNSLGAIKISHATDSGDAFSSNKKVVVTATSTNNWSLVMSGDTSQTISYTLKTAASDTSAVTEFTFTAEQVNAGTSQDIRVSVEEYSTKKAGDYEDEITYEVKVEDAVSLLSLTVTDTNNTGTGSQTFYYAEGETMSFPRCLIDSTASYFFTKTLKRIFAPSELPLLSRTVLLCGLLMTSSTQTKRSSRLTLNMH